MPNAKDVRNRQRATHAVRNSKGTSRTKQASVHRELQTFPPELRAPITAEIERQLKELVAKFGEKKVREALHPLLTKCKWNYWQCVANAISRIARQK
jgi:hypothetical protein